MELPPADLGPTASLTQTLSLLREVLASHDSSVVPLDARQADFAQVNSNQFHKINLCPSFLLFYHSRIALIINAVILNVGFHHHVLKPVFYSTNLFVVHFPFQVLSCILDPLLQLCTVSASNLGTADMASYMVNSLYVMKTTLALFEFTDKRLEMLEFQVGPQILPPKQ